VHVLPSLLFHPHPFVFATALLQVPAATLSTITGHPAVHISLSTPRLPLFLVPCSSSFPVQGDDFYLLTPVIATLATSQQFTVQPSLVPILCPRYSPSSLCQILSFDVNQPETGVDRSVLTPTNSSVLIKRTVQSQTATTLCLRKRRLDVLDQVVMQWYVFITIGICTQT
jgi:hypothetical protein